MKKLGCILFVVSLLFLTGIQASALEAMQNDVEYPTGALPITEEQKQYIRANSVGINTEEILVSNPTTRTYPKSIDNSNSEYFPLIKQQTYSSCAAWSAV